MSQGKCIIVSVVSIMRKDQENEEQSTYAL